MSALMLHGVVDAAAAAPADAAPHDRPAAAGLVALCTSLATLPETEDEVVAGALAHNALLVAQAQVGDVLPVRYPTAFSGVEALRAHLRGHARLYRSGLGRIDGAREYGLRLTARPGGAAATGAAHGDAAPSPGAAAGSGRAFLERGRLRRDRRSARAAARIELAERLADDAGGLARAAMTGAARADRLLDLALLVPAGNTGALQACVEAASAPAADLGLDLALTGPWPPYSFAQTPERDRG